MNNLTIKPATPEDAKDHYEVFDSCHDLLFGLFVILSLADSQQMESHDDESICMALNYYARLGLLVLGAMYEPVHAMHELITAQKEGEK
jgi:hypothetical protein